MSTAGQIPAGKTHAAPSPGPCAHDKVVAPWLILLLVGADLALNPWVWLPVGLRRQVRALGDLTGGLIDPYLLVGGCSLIIIVVCGMLWLGGLRPADLGLRRRDLLPGALFGLCLWAVVNAYLVVTAVAAGAEVMLHTQWTMTATHTVGGLLGQWLGVALHEELVYRGFLFNQLTLYLMRRQHVRASLATIFALAASSAIFAAGHIPTLWRHGTPLGQWPADLGLLLAYGVIFGLVYWRSRNLLYSVALHGLVLATGVIVPTSEPIAGVLVLAAIAWLVVATLHTWLRRNRARRSGGSGVTFDN